MKKQEIHPELQEFKAVLMKFNKKKSNIIHELTSYLLHQNGFIKTELNKMHDLVKSGEYVKESGLAFLKGLEKLVSILNPILGIRIISANGYDYEKNVDLLVKRINSLPEDYRSKVLEQINSFVLSDGNQTVTYELLKSQLDYIESLGNPEDASEKDRDDLIISASQ